MRQFLIPSILFSGLLLFAPAAALIAAPQQGPYGVYYHGNDFRDNQLMFSRVRADIDQAESSLPLWSNGRERFDRVRGELSELQRHWDESTYEPSNVDNVIGALNRALDSSGIRPQDRDQLAGDMMRLRDFRDTHE